MRRPSSASAVDTVGLVLAGGDGERLRSASGDAPKAVLPVLDVPMVVWAIGGLVRAGVRRIAINVQRRHAPQLERALALRELDAVVTVVVEPRRMGSARTVLQSLAAWNPDARLLVVHADVIHRVDLGTVVDEAIAERADVMLAVARRLAGASPVDGDSVAFKESSKEIVDYRYKPEPSRSSPYVPMGAAVISPATRARLCDALPASGVLDLDQHVLPGLARDGAVRLVGSVSRSPFLDLGTPDRLLDANFKALTGSFAPAPTGAATRLTAEHLARLGRRGVSVSGAVAVGHGSHIGDGCTLEGPLVIGSAATIAPHAQVGRAVVLPSARIERGEFRTGLIGTNTTSIVGRQR